MLYNTGVVAIMVRSAYRVKESDRFVNITVLLDQPSCMTIVITAVPRLRSPPNAASSKTNSNIRCFHCFYNCYRV